MNNANIFSECITGLSYDEAMNCMAYLEHYTGFFKTLIMDKPVYEVCWLISRCGWC